jgi:4a-hydroxytetrahydrobiopterin dehydratase
MALLTDAEIASRLTSLNGWTRDGDAIRKQYSFPGFPEAVSFVGRLVPGCEAADHHPDIVINYRKVSLSFTTHSESGLTEKDFEGARTAERAV